MQTHYRRPAAQLILLFGSMTVALPVVAAPALMDHLESLPQSTHDKLHFGISAAISFSAEAIVDGYFPETSSVTAGVVLALVPGVLKEIRDHAHGETYSKNWRGLEFDAAGALVGAWMPYYLRQHYGVTLFKDPKRKELTLQVAGEF